MLVTLLAHLPPELAAIVNAWDALPAALRDGIMAMVRAATPHGSERP